MLYCFYPLSCHFLCLRDCFTWFYCSHYYNCCLRFVQYWLWWSSYVWCVLGTQISSMLLEFWFECTRSGVFAKRELICSVFAYKPVTVFLFLAHLIYRGEGEMPLHLKLKPIHVPFRAADMQRIQVYVTLTIMLQKRTLRSLPMLACTHTHTRTTTLPRGAHRTPKRALLCSSHPGRRREINRTRALQRWFATMKHPHIPAQHWC